MCAVMGLFFYTAGPVRPTQATFDQQAQRCVGRNNQSYFCESGHCCEDLQCCSYYYELWWFWLMCAVILIVICCCVWRHRRIKHRLQQQQRQHEINLIAYQEACNYTSTPFYFRFLPSYLLPDYEDVTNDPLTPPPPYCNLNLNTGPPACTINDQEEAQCPSRQVTPVPTTSSPLCSRPGIAGLEYSQDDQHRADGTGRETMLKQDQERDVEESEEEKDGFIQRQRHFTGDSGIEVCLCSQETESQNPEGLDEPLTNEGPGGSMELCESCGARDDKDGEQGTELDRSPSLEFHPFCLYLHTIDEQEGPQGCQS